MESWLHDKFAVWWICIRLNRVTYRSCLLRSRESSDKVKTRYHTLWHMQRRQRIIMCMLQCIFGSMCIALLRCHLTAWAPEFYMFFQCMSVDGLATLHIYAIWAWPQVCMVPCEWRCIYVTFQCFRNRIKIYCDPDKDKEDNERWING